MNFGTWQVTAFKEEDGALVQAAKIWNCSADRKFEFISKWEGQEGICLITATFFERNPKSPLSRVVIREDYTP